MPVKSIAYVAYPGKDVPKLLRFYKDVLGLRLDRVHPSESEARMVEFSLADDQWFSLLPEDFMGRSAGTGCGVTFEVDDVEETLARVRAAGVTVEGDVQDFPSCRMAAFEDPEGNKLSLHETKQAE